MSYLKRYIKSFNFLVEQYGGAKYAILLGSSFILAMLFFFSLGEVNGSARIYFLDVGQGDSELIMLPGGVEMLIDGGPLTGDALTEIADTLPFTDKYIDIVFMSHAQQDHFGGLIKILELYDIGLFVHSGGVGTAKSFQELKRIIKEKDIPELVLGAGDSLRYEEYKMDVISPRLDFVTDDINESSLVMLLSADNVNYLFTGDIGVEVERGLLTNIYDEVDVLKVSHHGSRFSSDPSFLASINPKVAVIEVGRNSYGHPTNETLNRLSSVGAKIFRTDQHGSIKIFKDGTELKVHSKK